ncbi:MAG: SNF2-related protein [Nanoarchaeota archaeon]|nr:SNF2-related protein [Nanoarchaeota archaeon]
MELKDITKSDIEDFADYKAIFERGRRYYRTGKIISMEVENDRIIAKVEGNYGDYDVEIYIDEDGEIEGECNCPYKGYGCKHIVAVMLKWVNEMDSIKNSDIKNKKPISKKNEFDLNDLKFKDIENSAATDDLLKGFDLMNSKKVKIKHQEKDNIVLEVKDGKTYSVLVENSYYFRDPFSIDCSCRNYGANCIHKLAALLTLLNISKPAEIPPNYERKLKKKLEKERYSALIKKLEMLSPEEQIGNARKYQILFNIAKKENGITLSVEKALCLKKGGLGKSSIVSEQFIKNNYKEFSPSIKKAFDLILMSNLGNYYYSYSKRKIIKEQFEKPIDFEILRKLRDIYLEKPNIFVNCHFPNAKVNPEIYLSGSKKEGYSFEVIAKLNNKTFNLKGKHMLILGEDPLWVYSSKNNGNLLFELQCAKPHLFKTIIDSSNVRIGPKHIKDFIEKYYLPLSSIGKVMLPKGHEVEEINSLVPKPRIFLSDYSNSFCIQLRFLYGENETVIGNNHDIIFRDKNNRLVKIKRDMEKEKEFFSTLLDNHTKEYNGTIMPSIDPFVWLTDEAKNLISIGYEIYGQDKLVNHKIRMERPQMKLNISSGIDWFDLKVDVNFGDEKVPLNKIMDSLSNYERFIKLSDGSMGVIPKKWLAKLSGVTGLLKKGEKKNLLKATASQIAVIESLLDIANKTKVDNKFKSIQKKFSNFKGIKNMPLPKNLNGKLRDYQKAGYNWLHFLKEFSFGGCLADDMGLGKTVQVLSLLLYEKEKGSKKPSLIIVPTSLVFNWVQEVDKFTPNLNVYVHHGQDRLKKMAQINSKKPDIIVTTYDTLRNDVSMFKKRKFHYIVLDESQKIKNPLAKNTKSVFSLKSKYRLVMTGTPIENTSLELWSQFAFLNPGLLGNLEYFKRNFTKSIEKNKDKNKAKALRNIVNPFLLSRKKENVNEDLPDKQIIVIYCKMQNKQRAIYDFWKEKFRDEIQKTIKEKGFMRSKMKILQGLMKLRQISNHPLLVDESFKGSSGKFDLLIEQIEEVISKGHKVLIFSSFVKMLKIFKDYFLKRNINFSYLDGKTKKRKEVVEEFQQNEEVSAFLISLKAGGLGLNLTAADYVFIIDPWWNPAAEMQAIDRAHRIGQNKKVFVYKAITKESVEEKILELQQSKLDLVKNIITVEEGIFKKLNKEDINKMFSP